MSGQGKLTRQCRSTYAGPGRWSPWEACGYRTDDDCRKVKTTNGVEAQFRVVDESGNVVQPNTEKLGERPGRLELGQRWVEHDAKATPYTVVAIDPAKGAQIKFDDQQNSDGYWHKSASILGDRYLGTTEEPAKPCGCGPKGETCDAHFLGLAPVPALPPKREAPPRREVSHNGRDWTSYDSLVDADPWDEYKHRREVFADGLITLYTPWMPMRRTVGKYGRNVCEPTTMGIPRSEFQRAERKPLGLLTEWELLEDMR